MKKTKSTKKSPEPTLPEFPLMTDEEKAAFEKVMTAAREWHNLVNAIAEKTREIEAAEAALANLRRKRDGQLHELAKKMDAPGM